MLSDIVWKSKTIYFVSRSPQLKLLEQKKNNRITILIRGKAGKYIECLKMLGFAIEVWHVTVLDQLF